MFDRELFRAQKEMLAEQYSHAHAYTNLLIVAGYAGSFAIWDLLSNNLTPVTSFSVGILLATSLATYIAWEIFAMIVRFAALESYRRSVDDPKRFAEQAKRHAEKSQLSMRRLERYWPIVLVVAVGAAVLAIAILLSAFVHGLFVSLVGKFPREPVPAMDVVMLLIVVGAFVGVLSSVVVLRIDAKITERKARKNFASALRDDLLVAQSLFGKLLETWQRDRLVSFELLDEIQLARIGFLDDRPSLWLLRDADMKARLLELYRESEVVLNRLRHFQQQVYKIKGPEAEVADEIAKMEGLIEAQFERLDAHSLAAERISDQLFIRY